MAYPIFLLREDERDLHRLLRSLEEALVRTLADFGLAGIREPGKTGVWIAHDGGSRKLASIGVAVRKWVTLHGLALNVTTDLARFGAINPCGFDATVMTSMARACTSDMIASASEAGRGAGAAGSVIRQA